MRYVLRHSVINAIPNAVVDTQTKSISEVNVLYANRMLQRDLIAVERKIRNQQPHQNHYFPTKLSIKGKQAVTVVLDKTRLEFWAVDIF